jgi:hypothetical protein
LNRPLCDQLQSGYKTSLGQKLSDSTCAISAAGTRSRNLVAPGMLCNDALRDNRLSVLSLAFLPRSRNVGDGACHCLRLLAGLVGHFIVVVSKSRKRISGGHRNDTVEGLTNKILTNNCQSQIAFEHLGFQP